MYGRAEHTEAWRRITRAENMIMDLRSALQSLRDDLRQDDIERTEHARDLLHLAGTNLQDAARAIETARAELPEPVADESRWPTRAEIAALWRAGGNDVA